MTTTTERWTSDPINHLNLDHQRPPSDRTKARYLVQDFNPTLKPAEFDRCAIGDLIDFALFVIANHDKDEYR